MDETGSRGWTSVIFLCLIMTCIAVAVGGIAFGTLYQASVEQHKVRLAHIVQSTAMLIRTVLEDKEQQDAGIQDIATEIWNRIRESQSVFPLSWFSSTGELRLGSASGEEVTLLVGLWNPREVAQHSEPRRDARLSEPMRRALDNQAGVFLGQDHNGDYVLAVHEPLPDLRLGVVASVDLQEIRAPFLKAGSVIAGSAVILILFGAYLFFAISDPIMARIREGEARFRELFDSMRSGAAVVEAGDGGRQFVLKDLNRAGERIDAIDRKEVLGQRIDVALPRVCKYGLLSAIARVWRSAHPEHLPVRLGEDEKNARWREQYIYRLPNREVVVLYDDVTDQKQAEQVLRDNEARWRSIIEMQSIAIVIVDQENHIRFVNRAAELLFGHAAGKLIGAPFGFHISENDVAEIEITRTNGRVVYAEMQSIPMTLGGEQQFLLFIRDISAHRRAEGDLRKLFQAIEQSPVSVVITDLQGKIEYVNPKFTETTGYTYPEVVGKNPRILKSGYTSAAEYANLWKTIGAGQVWRGEFQNRKKNGTLLWEMASIAPVRDVHGRVTHYVCVKEDITERKGTEERLRQAHKMHAIGELTGGIAHDFNNLLAIIIGNLQLLEEELADNDPRRELISDAMWSAERGAELISRLLAFSRRQRLNPKATDLNQVVREMTDLLRRTLGETIEIREILAPALVKTMIDQGQLQNVLLNLTVNARDAMPKGGVLTITTENAVLMADEIEDKHGVKPGEYAVMSITDTGVGMPADVLERIFEPFFSTKPFGKGSGLGLSMVYGFVTQSGGHITVDSEVGRGTTIKLYLPKVGPEEGKEDDADARGRRNGEIVLIVESDDRIRKTAAERLRRKGFTVLEAGNAAEALSQVEESPRLDVLFTEVVMPDGMSGIELAQEVHRRRDHVRVLFACRDRQDILDRAKGSGEKLELLAKPYRTRVLAQKVREILDRPPMAG